ncbi:MAG: flagellar assembly peptidoglycan hydrolase FlgJ, partial [Thermotoga sp.]
DRFPVAWQYRDQPFLYFLALQVHGYATDPYYFQKLVKIYRQLKGGEL